MSADILTAALPTFFMLFWTVLICHFSASVSVKFVGGMHHADKRWGVGGHMGRYRHRLSADVLLFCRSVQPVLTSWKGKERQGNGKFDSIRSSPVSVPTVSFPAPVNQCQTAVGNNSDSCLHYLTLHSH
ncbi:uncharacterized protein BDZ83DRAFT_618462 [Colletotrichum acutatum]|uniref:Uncharacterized protein n=1 Tax=Glomerella acutata TaxID=27357 RepID=A0AAD8UK26_GLOAC|nr:uncharacterized protein BDZ83DRAFT_618462 [Colletotrichum acutatum]KAK1725792.1 hypothetical protein BDZ83DRAFT_618462 [Colletotrichum acutatum]